MMQNDNQNRILSLDIMRGFSICGIFLVNMLSFHSPILYIDPFLWWKGKLNTWTYMVIDVFAQGSFYPLFALLFGYGLVILRDRTISKGNTFMPIALRRFLFLLIVGIFHAFFVWHGDILINYALCGILLMLFLKGAGKGMVMFGILLSVIPNLLFYLLLVFANTETNIYSATDAYQSVQIYQQGSFIEITKQRIADWYTVNNPLNLIFLLFSILPFFLIGGGAAKFKWAERAKTLRRRFVPAFFLFFVIGLFIKTMPYVFGKNLSIEYLQNSVGGPFLAVAYALGIAVLTESNLGRKCFSYLAPVGKMSISNYLFQSVLSTWIFYSNGFGLYGKISVFAGTVLALFIYVFQIYFSYRWLTTHYFGPVEWLWRSITYKKKQPWKRVAA